MSGTTDVHTVVVLQGFGQGTSTATVLTNRAETMTIVDRHSDIYGEKHTLMSSKRGARPMHRTTLDLRLGNDSELQAGQGVLRSIASMSYSGSKDLEHVKRPDPYPNQYTSQFSLGEERLQADYETETRKYFPKRETSQAADVFERAHKLATHQMAGADMITATQQSTEMSFTSQYTDVHDRLGQARGPGVACPKKSKPLRDPITGELKHDAPTKVNLMSGNRVLKAIRDQCPEQNLLK